MLHKKLVRMNVSDTEIEENTIITLAGNDVGPRTLRTRGGILEQ